MLTGESRNKPGSEPDDDVRGESSVSQSRSLGEADWFYGRYGLRAAWGIALYLAAACVLVLLAMALLSLARGSRGDVVQHVQTAQTESDRGEKPGRVALNDGALLLAIGTSAFLMARLERRSPGVYGLGFRHAGDALPGAFAGLLLLSTLVALLHALGLLVVDGVFLPASRALRSGGVWLCTFASVGLYEEYLFRGYLQYTLMRGLCGLSERISPERSRAVAFALAAIVLSLLFCFVHTSNGGETASGLVAVFVAGLVFSYALWRTGSLWWAVGFHAAWDWAESFLFGVPDSGILSAGRLLATHPAGKPLLSGGPAGPEGSVLVLPTLLLVVLVVRMLPQRPQPPLEPEG